ncbi:MAG: histidinol-phosphate transaminase [Desulfurococcales archaeon]|nr:histidinol-phosphate transaminase [Desulfurococcales archaeon]
MGGSVVRLDLNESPFPPPPEVVEAAKQALQDVNRYPGKELVRLLEEELASYAGVPRERVVVGCGGDSLLALLALITSPIKERRSVYPEYSFTMYEALAEEAGFNVKRVPMRPSGDWWVLDEDALFSLARDASIIFIDLPNNPTGSLLISPRRVAELAEEARGLVIADEAYYEFSGVTVASLAESYDNLVVVRTLSKAFSMAGLRVGYTIAPKEVASKLRRLTPFPTSKPGIAAALEALRRLDYVSRVVAHVRRWREVLRERLNSMGAKAYNSHANFILVDFKVANATEKLAKKGIIVRKTMLGDNYARVTVGSESDNEAFLEAAREVLG